MPWKATSVIEVRLEFVQLAQTGQLPFRGLCERFGISAPTGYKWLGRYAAEGAAGLPDRAHRHGARPPGGGLPTLRAARPASCSTMAAPGAGPTWTDRFTPLTVWLRRHGVAVSHSRPYHPQTLGKDERFHGTLQRELIAQPPAAPTLNACQATFAAWRHRYHHVRPHDSLALAVPADRYAPSPRPYPDSPPPWPYGPDDQVRNVQAGGQVSFQGRLVRWPRALRGYAVAFHPAATDGCWDVVFMSHRLRTLDLRQSPEAAKA